MQRCFPQQCEWHMMRHSCLRLHVECHWLCAGDVATCSTDLSNYITSGAPSDYNTAYSSCQTASGAMSPVQALLGGSSSASSATSAVSALNAALAALPSQAVSHPGLLSCPLSCTSAGPAYIQPISSTAARVPACIEIVSAPADRSLLRADGAELTGSSPDKPQQCPGLDAIHCSTDPCRGGLRCHRPHPLHRRPKPDQLHQLQHYLSKSLPGCSFHDVHGPAKTPPVTRHGHHSVRRYLWPFVLP